MSYDFTELNKVVAKIPVDDKEAATVYNAFKEFLVWNRLSRE